MKHIAADVMGVPLLARTAQHAERYLNEIASRHVGATLKGDDLRSSLRNTLPDDGEDVECIIDELADVGLRATTASQGPRYFGFVTGGSLPAATAADWLVSAWDQNAQTYVMSPIAAVIEEITATWVLDLLRLPASWSVGFVTGAQMANFTGLLLARQQQLEIAGWDLDRDGLVGAPPIEVILSEEAHRTILSALRMLGVGRAGLRRVATDDQGRMRPEHLKEIIADVTGPCIVCAQAGNVNTGSVDPLQSIADVVRGSGAWLHVDAAFGAWAASSDSLRGLVRGMELADSIATDGHKWLNAPYDSGIVLTAHAEAHRRALLVPAHYIALTDGERDPRAFTPEESRRARGVPIYAVLRALGRRGVSELVERCCRHARRMADALRRHRQICVLNNVVLNQVLVQFLPLTSEDAGDFTARVVAEIQAEGTCWIGDTQWHGCRAARISICNWSTSEADIDRSAEAIIRVVDRIADARSPEIST